MSRFDMLVDEFKTKLERNLFQKETEWIHWVVEREKYILQTASCDCSN